MPSTHKHRRSRTRLIGTLILLHLSQGPYLPSLNPNGMSCGTGLSSPLTFPSLPNPSSSTSSSSSWLNNARFVFTGPRIGDGSPLNDDRSASGPEPQISLPISRRCPRRRAHARRSAHPIRPRWTCIPSNIHQRKRHILPMRRRVATHRSKGRRPLLRAPKHIRQ